MTIWNKLFGPKTETAKDLIALIAQATEDANHYSVLIGDTVFIARQTEYSIRIDFGPQIVNLKDWYKASTRLELPTRDIKLIARAIDQRTDVLLEERRATTKAKRIKELDILVTRLKELK